MKKHILGLVLSLAALAPAAYADVPPPVTFTVTAHTGVNAFGYTKDVDYTFVFKTASVFTGTLHNSQFNGVVAQWGQNGVNDDRLFDTVSGTGLSGTFTNPNTEFHRQASMIRANISDSRGLQSIQLEVATAADNGQQVELGLRTPDGTALGDVGFNFTGLPGNTFNPSLLPFGDEFTRGYVDPNAFFGSLTGSYDSNLADLGFSFPDGLPGGLSFTATNLTISTSAVPEPSTYAAIFGAAALGFGVYRRRQPRA